jgi:hypothetical protein
VASRREEKERLRQIREEAEKREAAEQRRKLLLGYAVAGLLGAAVLGGIAAVILSSGGGGASGNSHIVNTGLGTFVTTQDLEPDDREGTETDPGPLATAARLPQAAKAAGCVLRNPKDEGNLHLAQGQPTPNYKSNPPTSGSHDPIPLTNGVYRTPLEDFRHVVHSMEHGRVMILYSSDLSEADQLKLKGVVDDDFRDIIMVPYDQMPYQVAAVAWGHYLGCKAASDRVFDAVRAFRDTYRDRGPEPATNQPS